jgi:hypothetical protein
MRNPWLNLDLGEKASPRYVHPADEALVSAYEAKRRGPDYQLATHLLPEPWVGRLDAPVVVLLANPGVSEREGNPKWSPNAAERQRASATIRQKKLDVPYYWLDDELSDTDGYEWAVKLFGRLAADVGGNGVARNMVSLAAHPYHSSSFDDRLRALHTQRFTLAALRRAISQDALVVALRARKYWFSAVPELEEYERRGRVLRTSAMQNTTLAPGNVEHYDDLCFALSGASRD